MTQFWINPTHVSVLISSPYCSMIMYKVKWNEIWFVGLKGIVSRDGEMMERYLYGPAENSNIVTGCVPLHSSPLQSSVAQLQWKSLLTLSFTVSTSIFTISW